MFCTGSVFSPLGQNRNEGPEEVWSRGDVGSCLAVVVFDHLSLFTTHLHSSGGFRAGTWNPKGGLAATLAGDIAWIWLHLN